MEIRGSGWYRLSFACTITGNLKIFYIFFLGGNIKTKPDKESLSAAWHSIDEIRRKDGSVQLRCRDFLNILSEAQRFYEWKERMSFPEKQFKKYLPLLNHNESQSGLFVEFVIINQNTKT